MSTDSDQAYRRAEALFKKEQQGREGQQAMAEYEAKLEVMREKTTRLRRYDWLATQQTRNRRPPTLQRVRPKAHRSQFSTSLL